MTKTKAQTLADVLGGSVENLMAQSREPGVRLSLSGGRVALLDELGGVVFGSDDAVQSYAVDGDDERHVELSAEWESWGICEEWARGLARLIEGQAHQSGGNVWVVLSERSDGGFVVIG